MTKDKALDLALEVLIQLRTPLRVNTSLDAYDVGRAITAIKQALAAPVQEPDRVRECAQRLVEHADFRLGGVLSADSKAKDIPSKAVSQVKARHLASLRDALAATPPAAQRQWVGLTDWEISQLWIGTSPYFNEEDFARAIEAKLKEKNT